MTKWYALDRGGDMVYLGEFETFDEVCEADGESDASVWIVDEEGARDWLAQLKGMLT